MLVDSGGSWEPENVIFPYLKNLGLTPRDLDVVIVTHSVPVEIERRKRWHSAE